MKDDLIRRQAAIEVILDDKIGEKSLVIMRALGSENEAKSLNMACDRHVEFIKEIPSAQPEIIRCKDCKWYGRTDKRRFYRGMDCLQKRIDTIVPDKDFCSRAERREE